MSFDRILGSVGDYYSDKVVTHGPSARGVDWNSPESQRLRFEQLLRIRDGLETYSLLDYGCGYGALLDLLTERGERVDYTGFDISDEMVRVAREQHPTLPPTTFVTDDASLAPADFAVASGIFNVRLGTPTDEWQRYVLHTLDRLDALSRRGFSFNVLTSYSDPERMRPDLHYADPLALFDHCKRRYSRYVAILHDYPLYEFTVLVRKLE